MYFFKYLHFSIVNNMRNMNYLTSDIAVLLGTFP
jgi:hypothetical protein